VSVCKWALGLSFARERIEKQLERPRPIKPNNLPKLLTIADLSKRWDMPRQSLHEKKGEYSFPLPVQYVANDRTALFLESDILEYEEANPYIKTRAQREARRNFIFKLHMDAAGE